MRLWGKAINRQEICDEACLGCTKASYNMLNHSSSHSHRHDYICNIWPACPVSNNGNDVSFHFQGLTCAKCPTRFL